MNIAQKQLTTRRNHDSKQCMCKRFTRVYENPAVSFAIHTYFNFENLILKCLAKWKSVIFAPKQSVTSPTIMLFCMHFDIIFLQTHFKYAGRVYGIILPYSQHFTNAFLKTPLAPRKNCYNFTMQECENIFLGPDLSSVQPKNLKIYFLWPFTRAGGVIFQGPIWSREREKIVEL